MTDHPRKPHFDQNTALPVGFQQEGLRAAIDIVSNLRARIIRVGFFATLLYRPDPVGPDSPGEAMRRLGILRDEVTLIRQINNTLSTGAPLPDVAPEVARWLHLTAKKVPDGLAKITQLAGLSELVLIAVEQRDPILGVRLENHMNAARSGYYEAVTELCEACWADIATRHARDLDRATTAAKTLAERLNRLEHIGKHVRLVSLNASVEAARAGDVGKGLMVIAQEFKSLAEEIQSLAKEAREDMASIS